MLLSQVPVVIWNSQHNWVTFRHIGTQGGFGAQSGPPPKSSIWNPFSRIGEYLGGQAAGMGGIMFFLLAIAVVVAWQKQRAAKREIAAPGRGGDSRTRWVFLLSFTLPLWLFYFVMNVWKRTEVNWPAASYFTGMILLAGIFVEGWNSSILKVRQPWRVWGVIAITWGFLMTAAAMNTQRAYPFIAKELAPKAGTDPIAADAYFSSWLHPLKWDQPTVRLRGQQEAAAVVEKVRQEMLAETGQPPLIITGRYDTSSSLSFYLPGHPFVYCIMSSVGERQNQYDIWPGLNQTDPKGKKLLAGSSAILVGFDPPAIKGILKDTFERIEPIERYNILYQGISLRPLIIYKAYGFRELPAAAGKTY